MAHLTIEYSRALDHQVDMSAFCNAARTAMVSAGVFPLAGIRVRAFSADHQSLGDGGEDLTFIDMILRMGQGRDAAVRAQVLKTVYDTLADWCDGELTTPFAMSLEILEINAEFSEKRLNTIRPRLVARGAKNV
ncbi:MAG: 5-carboxymethyl-2-hydroxymuconate isomerase [Paracoccaceae bacterium]